MEFKRYFISRTLLREFMPDLAAQRLFLFQQLEKMSNYSGPKIIFSHILLPYTPYLFDRDGKKAGIRNTTFTHLGH